MPSKFHTINPGAVTGYRLNPTRGYFSVVVPEGTQNLVTNPSFEIGTTGWNDLSVGTLAQTADYQAFGAYALSYTPDANSQAGVYWATTTLEEDTTHTFSAYVWGAPGVPYRLYFYDNTNSRVISEIQFRGEGQWRYYHVTGATTDGSSHWIVIRKNNSTSTAAFYVDGVQLEEKAYPTTYCDGDMVGLIPSQNPPFYWLGARHASRSVRTAWTAAGGRVKRLDKAGFEVTSYIGTGMPPVQNIIIPNALTGGGSYQRTVPQVRPFTLTGDIDAGSVQKLERMRRDLENLFRSPIIQQPIMLRYQLFDDCGNERGQEIQVPVLLSAGLEGTRDNNYTETISIQLVAIDPHWRAVLESAETSDDLIVTVADSDFISMRDPTREFASFIAPFDRIWTRVSEGFDNAVRALAWGPDGKLYAGGDFINADNGAPVAMNHIAVYDPDLGEWNDLDTGVNGNVYDFAFDALGNLYVGGSFTEAGSGATVVNGIAMWDGAVWSAMGAGVGGGTATVHAVGVGSDNRVYIGGDFASVNAVAAENIAVWDGAAWAALFTSPNGTNGTVYAVQVDTDNQDDVYFGGDFTTVDGQTVGNIAKYNQNGGTASLLGSGLDNFCYAILLTPDGNLYAGGVFAQAGGNDVGPTGTNDGKIARWNGSAWAPLGGGLSGGDVGAFGFDHLSGELYIGGSFDTYYQNFRAAGIPTIDSFVGWNGTGFFQPDVALPDTPAEVYSILGRVTGELTVGHSGTGNLVCTALIFATNDGTADAYPRIVMSGEGAVYQILNLTTGQALYFNDLTIADGETVTLDLVSKSMFSTTRGNLLSKITSGSDLATWRLAPGENLVSTYLPNATASVSIIWNKAYQSVSGAVF